jgi:type I site-specific restriction endonuclease
MPDKEAPARIKINKLLEAAGWRFFADGSKPANIRLEPSVTIKTSDLDASGENFEKTSKGFIDFLLLDARGFPFIVLEATAEDKNSLVGKEQARKYASRKTAASCCSRMAICTTSGIWNAATRTSSRRFRCRNRSPAMCPVILDVYGTFIRDSANTEGREYASSKEEIEANLIHRSYGSQKDIETCLICDYRL